ncbi:MAG: IS1647-like transposase [Actinomycetia bacterium]|nr:IS1647-like transposase [Actinomycetes bacterium]
MASHDTPTAWPTKNSPQSKMHILSDANGLPLVVGLSAANVHDSQALKPMVAGLFWLPSNTWLRVTPAHP